MVIFHRDISKLNNKTITSGLRSYIIKTWIRNDARVHEEEAAASWWYKTKHDQISDLLASDNIAIYLATYRDDDQIYMGFLVYDNSTSVIEYAYVRAENRRDGVVRDFLTKLYEDNPDQDKFWFKTVPVMDHERFFKEFIPLEKDINNKEYRKYVVPTK